MHIFEDMVNERRIREVVREDGGQIILKPLFGFLSDGPNGVTSKGSDGQATFDDFIVIIQEDAEFLFDGLVEILMLRMFMMEVQNMSSIGKFFLVFI